MYTHLWKINIFGVFNEFKELSWTLVAWQFKNNCIYVGKMYKLHYKNTFLVDFILILKINLNKKSL